jgi:hypothetical protein
MEGAKSKLAFAVLLRPATVNQVDGLFSDQKSPFQKPVKKKY